MSAVDLTGMPMAPTQMELFDRGNVAQGSGGANFGIDRLGTRWAMVVSTPAMPMEPDGRRWGALLVKAKRRGAILAVCQDGFDVRDPGAPMIAADVASGRTIAIEGLRPRYEIRLGQWLSVIADGMRYLDQVATQVTANAAGEVVVELQNFILAPFAAGDVVELKRPKIQGTIPDQLKLDQPLDQFPALSFRIVQGS